MITKQEIDRMVTDICALDPELAKDESFVRALVSKLAENKPNISIDDSFRLHLREELLARQQSTIKKSPVPWWLVYTIPAVVTALLLLFIQPQTGVVPQQENELESDTVSPATMQEPMLERSMKGMDTNMMTPEADFGGSMVGGEEDVFMVSISSDHTVMNISYLSLRQPGFVVLSGPEGVLAKSELLVAGEHTDRAVSIHASLKKGNIYTASLYYDDGDGVFVEEMEQQATDAYGTPLVVPTIAP